LCATVPFRDIEIPRTLQPIHSLLKWNYVARPFCDTVDKIGELEVDVVRVCAKSTNCRSRMHVLLHILGVQV